MILLVILNDAGPLMKKTQLTKKELKSIFLKNCMELMLRTRPLYDTQGEKIVFLRKH